jgi:hypothetical protein
MRKISFPRKLTQAQKSKLLRVAETKIWFQALNFLIEKNFYNGPRLRIFLLK